MPETQSRRALTEYFRQPNFERALDAFVAAKPNWPLRARYEMYGFAMTAFDGSAGIAERQKAVDQIYRHLIDYWDILRPYSRDECWDADRVFGVLTGDCQAVGRESDISLRNFDASKHSEVLLACVRRFANIKPMTGDFPHMPASKLLHFFNPILFPIYDRAEVWNNVCRGSFKADYDAFCKRNRLRIWEASERFNLYYTWWAAEVMETADSAIGQVFAAWFARQAGTDVADAVIVHSSQYWGAMFEIAAIGAAHLDQ